MAKEQQKKKLTEGQRQVQKRRAGKISAKSNPPDLRIPARWYLPKTY